MEFAIASVFIIGYTLIACEHFVKINKSATAILMAVLLWSIYAVMGHSGAHEASDKLLDSVRNFAGIIFFLMGAMVIVELIDMYHGFDIITQKITTKNRRTLLWIISITSFFFSSVLDNLTTTIVMISLVFKLVSEKDDRLVFVSMVVIAANSGGAWTPIGDVTTTMLWIGNKITTWNIMKDLFIPSILCLVVPLVISTFMIKRTTAEVVESGPKKLVSQFEKTLVLCTGIGALMFVPVFKTITHLPPFMGILLGVSVIWILTEFLHKGKEEVDQHSFSVAQALHRIDMASVMFLLGILAAISALEAIGLLEALAHWLDKTVGNVDVIVIAMGLLSAIVDNVPLVAASMGMYDYPIDHSFWKFIAYCVGTGGSVLIIGSAAGVAAMGIAKIDFFWYLKRISLLALAGYFAGAGWYILAARFFNH